MKNFSNVIVDVLATIAIFFIIVVGIGVIVDSYSPLGTYATAVPYAAGILAGAYVMLLIGYMFGYLKSK